MMVSRFMSWLLIVQPNSAQADLLREALRTNVSADVVVVDSIDSALSLIDEGIPDVVLLPDLIPAPRGATIDAPPRPLTSPSRGRDPRAAPWTHRTAR